MIRHPLIILGAVLSLPLRAQTPASRSEASRRSVQAFYDWYVPRAAHPGKRDMIMVAATDGPLHFDPELVRWLRIDSTARARNKTEVDGLDGDPYLNSQDPCDKYTARPGRVDRGKVLVDVHGSGGCESRTTPDVIVELTPNGAGWTVMEFRDPHRDNEGLIPLLKRLHPKAR